MDFLHRNTIFIQITNGVEQKNQFHLGIDLMNLLNGEEIIHIIQIGDAQKDQIILDPLEHMSGRL